MVEQLNFIVKLTLLFSVLVMIACIIIVRNIRKRRAPKYRKAASIVAGSCLLMITISLIYIITDFYVTA